MVSEVKRHFTFSFLCLTSFLLFVCFCPFFVVTLLLGNSWVTKFCYSVTETAK